MHTLLFPPSPVDFVHPQAARSSLVVLSLGWTKGLWHYRSIALLGVTHASRGNSASKFQGLEVLSSNTPYEQHPQRRTKGDVIAKSYALRAIPYRRTYKSQKFFIWFTSDTVLQETRLSISRLLREVLRGDIRAKVVPETDYLTHFWRSHAWVPQGSQQADSALTCCQEQKPQEPRRTRWLQEMGHGAISPNSGASHPLHSYAVGYYSRSKYDVPWDWLREACHTERVRWKARCEGFCSKEGPHYWIKQSVRNQLECNQVQRALEKPSGSCLLTSNKQPISLVWKSLHDSSPGLHCVDFAEAYVMQENVSSRIFTRKGMICVQSNGRLHEKPSQRKAEQGKNAGTYSGARFPQLSNFKKHVMCSRNMGVHVRHGIRSTKGM